MLGIRVKFVYNTRMNTRTKQPQITLYLPQSLKEAVQREAKKQKRSMNSQVVWCLEQCLGGSASESGTRVQDRIRPQ